MAKWQLDMRIPVVFGAAPEAGDAVLIEGEAPAPSCAHVIRFSLPADPGHPPNCACCAPRGPVAEALGRAFRDRVTGAVPFFGRVLVASATPAAVAAIRAALAADAVTAARYRGVIPTALTVDPLEREGQEALPPGPPPKA